MKRRSFIQMLAASLAAPLLPKPPKVVDSKKIFKPTAIEKTAQPGYDVAFLLGMGALIQYEPEPLIFKGNYEKKIPSPRRDKKSPIRLL